jgi:hypothetical protein
MSGQAAYEALRDFYWNRMETLESADARYAYVSYGDLQKLEELFVAALPDVAAAQEPHAAPGMHPLSGLIANSYALCKFAQGGEWLTCEEDGHLDMRKELLAVKAAVREALKPVTAPQPAPELARVRALLDEIGVMAANAPEDGDSFGVLEQIAMRIAAAGVEAS